MASYFRVGQKWAVAYDGRLDGKPKGKRSYIYGIKTESLAKRAKAQKDIEEQLLRAGLYKPDAQGGKTRRADEQPIEEHITWFETTILNRGKQPKHAQQQAAHVRRLLGMAGIQRLSGLDDAAAVQAAAKRLMDEGDELAPSTANAAIRAIRQFSTSLFVAGKLDHDVLHKRLTTYNEDEDKRRQRRALSEEEITWLLNTTAAATDGVSRPCGISPADRAMLYATGLGTGYRRGALLTLTKDLFHVGEGVKRPFIRLAAARNKKRRDRDQPIRRDLAAQLREWLSGRPDSGPVWRPLPHADLALRFRRDMERARAAWIAAAPTADEGEQREESNTLKYAYHDGVRMVYADFHGLRHTGISLVVRRAGLKVAQWWADHSTPVLTSKYAHLDESDQDRALEALTYSLPSQGQTKKSAQAPGTARRPERSGSGWNDPETRKAS
jgi:hypothetical protein